jgi:hypothetical protein
MGWTYCNKIGSTKEFLESTINGENEHGKWTVLDTALKNFGRVAYMAVEKLTKETGEVTRFGLVMLVDHNGDYGEIGYKDIDESMGPRECECPERILKLLEGYAPINEYSASWREKCWTNIKARKYHNKGKKAFVKNLKAGDRIVDIYGREYTYVRPYTSRSIVISTGVEVYRLAHDKIDIEKSLDESHVPV